MLIKDTESQMNNETWFGVAMNYELFKVQSPDMSNLNILYWIKTTQIGEHTTNWGNTHPIYI